jgi:hypothetical protein
MRKSVNLSTFSIICLIALLPTDRIALGQAGSTGGTLGKTDKSASGGEEQSARPSTRKRAAAKSNCESVRGAWEVSWQGITSGTVIVVLKADGTASNSAGNDVGTWHCSEGAVTVTYNDGLGSDHLIVSSNGKRLTGTGRMGATVSATRQ